MLISSPRGSSGQGWVVKLKTGFDTAPQTGWAGLKGPEGLILVKSGPSCSQLLEKQSGMGIDSVPGAGVPLGPNCQAAKLGPRWLEVLLERIFPQPGSVELKQGWDLSSGTGSREPRAKAVHLSVPPL